MNCCKTFSISITEPALICTDNGLPATDYYTLPMVTQPDPVYFQDLATIEAILSGSGYDNATVEPVWDGTMPLYDTGNNLCKVRYMGASSGNNFSLGGKRITVWAYMYYQSPLGGFAPTWWLTGYCFSGGSQVSLFSTYKATGEFIVGPFLKFGAAQGYSEPVYTGGLTICSGP